MGVSCNYLTVYNTRRLTKEFYSPMSVMTNKSSQSVHDNGHYNGQSDNA